MRKFPGLSKYQTLKSSVKNVMLLKIQNNPTTSMIDTNHKNLEKSREKVNRTLHGYYNPPPT